jgi:hypothetical protein
MNLTASHQEILLHRLDSGAIADCLADTEELQISREDAENATLEVTKMVKSGRIYLDQLGYAQKEVLIDCLEGSTFFAGWEDAVATRETTRGRMLNLFKAAVELEEAFTAAFGRQINCTRS